MNYIHVDVDVDFYQCGSTFESVSAFKLKMLQIKMR